MVRREFDDDDWDDFEEYEEEKEPGILTTTRILVGLLVVLVVTILVARLVLWEPREQRPIRGVSKKQGYLRYRRHRCGQVRGFGNGCRKGGRY